MTVRIIKQRKMPEAFKETGCPSCGSVLEYTMFDTSTKTVTDYTGGKEIIRYILCPKCGFEISVR